MSFESIVLPIDAREFVEHEADIAARCDDLSDAHVQQAIARLQRLAQGAGASGDFAGAWFSGVEKKWARMSYGDR